MTDTATPEADTATPEADTAAPDRDVTVPEARPGDDRGRHRPDEGFAYPKRKPLEIWKPPTDGLHGYLDVEILDPYGTPPPTILKEHTPWRISFGIWLYGDIWKCVCGYFCAETYFERASDGERYSLGELLGGTVRERFVGCEDFVEGGGKRPGHVHVHIVRDVPAGALPAGREKPAVYDWTSVISFENECGKQGVITGFDKGCVSVYSHH